MDSTYSRPIGVFIHIFYEDLAHELASFISKVPFKTDIYISTDASDKQSRIIETFSQICPRSTLDVRVVLNCGWDIGPFVVEFGKIAAEYDIALKVHGKRSAHARQGWGDEWRLFLLEELIGDGKRAQEIVAAFLRNRDLGMVVPPHWWEIAHYIGLGENAEKVVAIASRMGLNLWKQDHMEFPSGSMFWFRGAAIKPLLGLNYDWKDFDPTEHTSRDETLAHAIERAFLLSAISANFKWAVVATNQDITTVDRSIARHVLANSGLFDWQFYTEKYPDVAAVGVDGLDHYLNWGWVEGRNPSVDFDTRYYQLRYLKDVPNCNPLLFYLFRGRQLGHRTKSLVGPLHKRGDYYDITSSLERIVKALNAKL